MEKIELIEARFGLAGNMAGTEKGPEKISGLMERDSEVVELNQQRKDEPQDAKNERQVRDFCKSLSEAVSETINEGGLPVVLGGDHSISIGSINGSASGSTGLIWMDAHADFNTPQTTPSGNIHGMPVATVTGRSRFDWGDAGIDEENVVMIGIRDVDEKEQRELESSDVNVFRMEEVKEKGIKEVIDETMEILSGVDNIHISFDLDYLDASEVPGVGTPVENGGSIDQAAEVVRRVRNEGDLRCLEIVELNPELDEEDRTARKAVELLERTLQFGKPVIND